MTHKWYFKYVMILLVCLIYSGILGMIYIQEPFYDFFNYHYYNGWAFWNNRIDTDFLVASYRSYFNPILDFFNFLLLDKLKFHPYIFLFISNLKYGIFLFLTYLIADIAFLKSRKTFILSSLFLAALSPIVIFDMKFDCTDIQLANLILLSFYLLILSIKQNKRTHLLLFLSAFMVGVATGLKYPLGVFAIPLGLSICLYRKRFENFTKIIFVILSGGLAGYIAANGWWMYIVYSHFKNPFFPYFNNVFKSNLANVYNFVMPGFDHLKNESIIDYIFMPLKNAYYTEFLGHEDLYVDSKIVVSFWAIIFTGIIYKIKNLKENLKNTINQNVLLISIIYLVSAYYINLSIFGTIRYVMPLFAISSIVIVSIVSVYSINFRKNEIYPVLFFIMLIHLLTFHHTTQIINPWHKSLSTTLTLENAKIPDNAAVLCAGEFSSFIVPAQNKKAKYIGYIIPVNILNEYKSEKWQNDRKNFNHYYESDYLELKITNIFKKTTKNLYMIFNIEEFENDKELYLKSISHYSNGTITQITNCKSIMANLFGIEIPKEFMVCKIK